MTFLLSSKIKIVVFDAPKNEIRHPIPVNYINETSSLWVYGFKPVILWENQISSVRISDDIWGRDINTDKWSLSGVVLERKLSESQCIYLFSE